jgi:methyl-accepting chemotaxis protein
MNPLNAIRNQSLKVRIVSAALGSVFLLAMGSVGILRYTISSQQTIQLKNFEGFARQLGEGIGDQFSARYHDAQVMAANSSLRSNVRDTMTTVLNQYVSLFKTYDLIMVIDLEGRLVAVNDRSPEGKVIRSDRLYQAGFVDAPWFKAVTQGHFTEDALKGFKGTYFESIQLDPWRAMVFGGNPQGSGFTTVIKDASGGVTGVLTTRANSRWFSGVFKGLYATLQQMGFAHSELMLASPTGKALFGYRANVGEDLDTKFNLQEKSNEAILRVTQGKTGGIYQGTGGSREQIAGFAAVSNDKFIDDIGWGVVISDDRKEVEGEFARARFLTNLLFSIAMCLALLASYWFSRRATYQLGRLARRLAISSRQVSHTAFHISGWSSRLSEISETHSSAIRQTAAAIEGISIIVRQSADNASKSHHLSEVSQDAARVGRNAVLEMNRAISEISHSNSVILNQVEEGNRQIAEIAKVISEIGNKTKVINDIVFQTKLLSFNASVEAARAGEHGKGFSVVAEEVGHLAEMSGKAAKEISSILNSSIRKVEGIVSDTREKVERLVHDGKEKLAIGTEVAQKCGNSLENIMLSVQEVDVMLTQISQASNDQLQGIEEVTRGMTQLTQITVQSDSISQQAGATADKLCTEAKHLGEMIASLINSLSGEAQDRSDGDFNSLMEERATVIPLQQILSMGGAGRPPRPFRPQVKVTGTGRSIPSKDDPRFEDV